MNVHVKATASSDDRTPTPQRYLGRAVVWVGLAGLLCLLLGVAYFSVPLLLWAYDIERAGTIMDTGLAWPESRHADTLPTTRNSRSLEQALGYLSDAIRWRPDHPHAYRLIGRIYTARGDWIHAVEAFEKARVLAPHDPLLAWETSLIYERMQWTVTAASRIPIIAALAKGQIEVAGQSTTASSCQNRQLHDCYTDTNSLKRAYAGVTDGPKDRAPVLFMYHNARIALRIEIPPDRAGLHFLIGLDPADMGTTSTGATFRVWVTPQDKPQQLVTDVRADRVMALQGWIPGWTDLSPWAGQTITLTFDMQVQPLNVTTADRYGWGAVELTSTEAARYASFAPDARKIQAWHAAGLDSGQFYERGNQARDRGRLKEANVWYSRAADFDARAGNR